MKVDEQNGQNPERYELETFQVNANYIELEKNERGCIHSFISRMFFTSEIG